MKKFFRLSASFVLMGALFAGCIENEVSPSLDQMRQAKADLIRANAEWVRAHAQVEQANAAYQNALAEVEKANAALIQAQVTVTAADVKIKEAEAKIKEAQAAQEQAKADYERIMNEYQSALNDLELQQNQEAFALKMQQLQQELDAAALDLQEKEMDLERKAAELEIFQAQKVAEIAKWVAETQGWQNVLNAALRADEAAAKAFEAEMMKANYELAKLANDLVDMADKDHAQRLYNCIQGLQALSALIEANMGQKAIVIDQIAELNARLTMVQELNPVLYEARFAEWEAEAAADLAYAKEAYEYAQELKAIQDAQNLEALKDLGKEVNTKIVEIQEALTNMEIQLAAIVGTPEYEQACWARDNAEGAMEGFQDMNDVVTREDIAAKVFATTVPANTAAFEAWTDTSMDAQDDVLASIPVDGKDVVAAIVNGQFGLYIQEGPDFVPVQGEFDAETYRRLLAAALVTAGHDRIFEYQAVLDAEALQKEYAENLQKTKDLYTNTWERWLAIYQEKGDYKSKKDAWLQKIDAYQVAKRAVAPAQTAVNEATAAKNAAQTAFNNAKAAADAAKAAVEAANAQARQDLVTYIQSIKDMILGQDSTPGADGLDAWLSSLQLSELLGGITFNPQELLKLFVGAPNYAKIEIVLNYIINEVNAADRLIGSARDFKAIIDGSESELGYFDLIKAYNGFEGADPVIEATSIYAYHAWFVLYALMEGVEVNIGNGVFTVGRFDSAVDQLMKHFLCNDQYAAMMAKQGGLVGVQNQKNQELTAANTALSKAQTALNKAKTKEADAKTACETAGYAWQDVATLMTNLEKEMFGAQYATKWFAEDPAKDDFTDAAAARNAKFFKADKYSQPDFHFYLDQFVEGNLLGVEGKYYPALENYGQPVIYWVGKTLWIHNVGLAEASKWYQCPTYTEDFMLWNEADCSTNYQPYYPNALAAIRKYENFMLVYNHQDNYKALAQHISEQITEIKATVDAANEAGRAAMLAEFDALQADLDAAYAKLDELCEPILKIGGEKAAAMHALDYYVKVYTELIEAVEIALNTKVREGEVVEVNEFVEFAKERYAEAQAQVAALEALKKVWEEYGVAMVEDDATDYGFTLFAGQAESIKAQIDAATQALTQLNVEQGALKVAYDDLNQKLQDLL